MIRPAIADPRETRYGGMTTSEFWIGLAALLLIGATLFFFLFGLGAAAVAAWIGPTAESDALFFARMLKTALAGAASLPLTIILDRRWTAREALRQLARN